MGYILFRKFSKNLFTTFNYHILFSKFLQKIYAKRALIKIYYWIFSKFKANVRLRMVFIHIYKILMPFEFNF